MKQQETETVHNGEPGCALGRRSALRKIVVGTGVVTGLAMLPDTWTHPVIEQIVLPAHAATSGSEQTENQPHPNQPALALTQCTMYPNGGDTSTAQFNPGVDGSVNPLTPGVPIQLVFTFIPTGTGPAGPAPQIFPVNVTTNAGGTYAVGIAPTDGPYASVSVIVTSSAIPGDSTTCSVVVPDPNP